MNNFLNKLQPIIQHKKLAAAASFLLGASVTLGFAPFGMWLFSIIPLVGLLFLIAQQSHLTAYWRTWFFALGFYSTGTSWIYVSISGFGGAPAPLAAIMVGAFSAFMAFFFCLPFYLFSRWLNNTPTTTAVTFAATWALSEWLRTWLMTGFPWLFLGYAHLHTPLKGLAPVLGVMGISFVCALTATTIWYLLQNQRRRPLGFSLATAAAVIWGAGFALTDKQWTQISTTPTSVVMVQPNVNQEDKWSKDFRTPMLEQLKIDSEPYWGRDLIIWPEAAVTEVYSDALEFLNEVNHRAATSATGLVTGIIYDTRAGDDGSGNLKDLDDKYYNSLVTFGHALGIYHKRRLVPFGEYVPFEPLRNVIEFFNLPTSIISRGPEDQRGLLLIKDLRATALVCYEIAFPDLVATTSRESQFLLSVSNLGWFGDSLGRHQFLEMAQMRALETQRYHLYNTNNGPSAIIDTQGHITAQSLAFTHTQLEGEFFGAEGDTPYMKWASYPLVGLSLLLIGATGFYQWRSRKHQLATSKDV